MKVIHLYFLAIVLFLSCVSDNDSNTAPQPLPEDGITIPPDSINNEPMYFPPVNSQDWETKSAASLQWNEQAAQELMQYLEQKHTKGFIILQNGRIVFEQYFNGHSQTLPWYWASAGKTLTAAVTGIAEQEGLDINRKVSDYIGTGWTSAPLPKENLITVKHLLTMTSGLDDTTGDGINPENLLYKADAGTRWAYANVYVKLQDIVAQHKNTTWNNYFKSSLKDKIGMDGTWQNPGNDLNVYFSTTRSMARFGLLMLNKGKWNNDVIVNEEYYKRMVNTSQDINKAYGYLWWLNGKDSFHLPQSQQQFNGYIIPTAPADMFAGLGKNDQKLYIIPSKKLVIVRMGDSADNVNLALSDFDEVLWQKINAVIN